MYISFVWCREVGGLFRLDRNLFGCTPKWAPRAGMGLALFHSQGREPFGHTFGGLRYTFNLSWTPLCSVPHGNSALY